MNDQEFVKKSLEGDREAYGALIDAYQGMVYVVALNITKDYTESEDIVQEAFLRAWENLATLSDPSRFSSWLYTLTKRLALRFLKQKGRIAASFNEDIDIEKIDSLSKSPSDEAGRKEINALLWKEVQNLPAKTREAILLYYAEGFSTVKAAEFLGIEEAAFRMRLKFGREKLRDVLLEKIEGELRRRQPKEKTKNAILAALPFVGNPKPPASPQETIPAAPFKNIPEKIPATSGSPASLSSGIAPRILLPLVLLTIGIVFYFIFFHNPGIEPPNSTPLLYPQNAQVDTSANNFKSPVSPAPPSPKKEPGIPPATGFLLEGTIIEKDTRLPIPMIAVSLHENNREIKKQITGSSGAVSFQGLPKGTYRIFLEPGKMDLSEKYFFDTYINGITVRIPGRDIRNMLIPLKPAASISGMILDSDSRPIENAEIFLAVNKMKQADPYGMGLAPGTAYGIRVPGKNFTYLTDQRRGSIRTSPDGKFKFTGLAPGNTYHVVCAAPGYCKTSVEDLVPQKNAPIRDLAVRLKKGSGTTVTGKVINEDGAPLEQVLVTATLLETGSGERQPMETNLVYESSFLTGETGEFVFRDVPPGSLSLNEFLGRCTPPMQVMIEPEKPEITVEMILKQDIDQGVLAGIIRDENGLPMRGGIVYARLNVEKLQGIGLVENNGGFRISGLPEGVPISLMYSPSGLSSWHPTDAADICASNENLEVARIGNPSLIQKTPGDKAESTIKTRGIVKDRETKKSIGFFSVQNYIDAAPADFPFWFYDEEGFFELENLAFKHGSENYLCARAENYRDNYQKILWGEGGEIQEFIFRMRNTPVHINIEGWVLDSLDNPIRDVTINLNGLNQPAVLTDETGAFSFSFADERYLDHHSPRAVYISAEHPDFAPWQCPKPLMLTSLGDEDIQINDYEIRLISGGVLQGLVTDEKGTGIANVPIYINHPQKRGKSYKTETETDGKYYQRFIPPGIYSVSAEAPVSNQKMVNIEEGKTSILNFTLQGGLLYGKVFSGKKPLGEAIIFLSDVSDDDLPSVFSAKAETGADGSYEIRGIPEGDYFLSLRKDNIYKIFSLHISDNEHLEKNILIQFGSIRGSVIFGKDEKSRGDLRITLSQTETAFSLIPSLDMAEMSSPQRSAMVDPEGNFSFEEVPSGRYILYCKTEDLGSAFLELDLEPEQELRDVLLRFPDTGSLEVRLIDAETGKKLNLEGGLLLKDDNQHLSDRSLRLGDVKLEGLNIGSYSIFAAGSDEEHHFYISDGMEDALVEAEKTNSATFRMKPGKQIEILVIDSNGELLGNCEAFLYDSEGSWQPIIFMRGSTIMGIAPIGDFRIVLFRSGKKFREIPLTIPPSFPGDTFRKTITLD